MLKKLWIVYNPRSSHHAAVEAEVLAPARKVSGFLVGKYEIKQTSVEHNAEMLGAMLGDGDLVVSAGGDGTAAIAANAVMMSGKDVVFSALGYGNFNDMARMFRTRRPVEYGGEYVGGIMEIIEGFLAGGAGPSGASTTSAGDVSSSTTSAGVVSSGAASSGAARVREIWPLEILVDGEHWRYAPCYVTLGLLAEASEIMDGDRVRKSLNTGKRGPLYSLWQAAWWYLKNKGREFLPASSVGDGSVSRDVEAAAGAAGSGEASSFEGASGFEGEGKIADTGEADGGEKVEVRLNGELLAEGATDYLAVNGPRVAKLMKGGKWYLSEKGFGSGVKRLGGFWRMVGFGLGSVIFGLKLEDTSGDVVEFSRASTVEIQAEGEYQRLEGVSKIEVRKAKRGMKVVCGK